MDINCSDYLFVQKYADFFLYDKKSAYLYPIDSLHFDIGKAIKEAFRRDGTILDIKYFIQNAKGYESNIIQDHYDFIISLFLEKGQVYSSNTVISLEDLENSIAIIPHIVVEVTEKCNFRCDYCYYGDMYDTQSGCKERINDMPEEDFLKCFRQLLANRNILFNNKLAISFYGGEPFLNFKLIKRIVELCEDEFPEIEFQYRATTNGSFLKNYLAFLIKYDFHLLVSLDGDEQSNIHRHFCNNLPAFSLVKENLDYIYNNHRRFFSNNIDFISVMHRDSDIVSICHFFSSNYKKTPILTTLAEEGIYSINQHVFPYEGVRPHEMQVLKDHYNSIYELIAKARTGASFINIPSPNCECRDVRGCFLFANKIFLAADRQIYLCERSSRHFPFGSFRNGVLRFYLEEINCYYEDIRKSVNKRCSSCSVKHSCDKCFFEGPSQMTSQNKCIISDTEMKKKLINALSYE